MHSLITSYLILSNECILPGIGVLKIIHTPASTDHSNSQLLPPFETILFSNGIASASPGLVQYISNKKHLHQKEAEDLISSFCKEWKEKINAGEKLIFGTIGSIQKNAGDIIFQRENRLDYFQPITVSKPFKKQVETHIEPVPEFEEVDREATGLDKTVVVKERPSWGLWALILLAIGLVILFYNFKDQRLTGSSTGNQHHFMVDSATATFSIP